MEVNPSPSKPLASVERQQVEKASWQFSQMLKLVLDHMPAFVFWKDRHSVYLGCNRLFAANAGLSAPEQIVGLTDLDLPWKQTEAERYRADDRSVMESGVPKLNYEETQLTAEGRLTVIRTSKIPLRNPEGQVIGVLGTFEDITERKRAEQLLAEAEAKYRCLVEESLVGVYLIQQGRFVYINECMAGIFGYSRQEVVGRPVEELVVPEDRDLVRANIQKREAGQVRTLQYGFHGLCKEGKVIEVEVLGTGTQYNGRPAVIGSLLDVTERKRAEQSIALLSFALKNVREAAFLIDEQARFHYVNEEACRLLGYTQAELLGLGVPEVDPDFPMERWPSHWSELKARRSASFEGRHRTKDGRLFPVEVSANYFEYGGKAYNLALVRDITERKRMEEALAAREREFRSLAENSPEPICRYDRECRQLYLSPAAGRLAGKPVEFLLGRTPAEAQSFPPAPAGKLMAGIRQVFQTGELGHVDLEVLQPDGRLAAYQMLLVPECGPEGQVATVLGLARDLTAIRQLNDTLERRVAERTADLEKTSAQLRSSQESLTQLVDALNEKTAALQAANKELEAFSYSVSHDLRAPLRGIDGFSDLLLRRCGGKLDEEGHTLVEMIRSSVEQMKELVEDMLTLSRVSRGELRMETVNLSAVARQVSDEFAQREPERKVALAIAPDLVVTGDAGLLRIALENLLGNAWKFTSKRPEASIEFGVFEQEGWPVFFVRDNGAGFDMKDAGRLFGAFQRLHSSADFPGTGVGLATVERVIRRHGGRVWAEARVDAGATFYFTLGASGPGAGRPT